MKGVRVALVVLLLGGIFIPSIGRATTKSVLISEVQTGSVDSASDEFVELYNNSDQPVDISGWGLYYKSSTGKSWTKKATIADGSTLTGHDFWVFASVQMGDTHIGSGLSESGGNIQLRDKQGNTMDQFGWGSADAALGQPASVAHGGEAMVRLYDTNQQIMTNTDNNFADFDITTIPTPGLVPAAESVEPDPSPQAYAKLTLSEVFPDPASPQSDNTDEFIEIYNPNNTAVSLDGWKLQDESGKQYIVKAKTVGPQSYIALYISETGITLNNTGDTVQLINPNDDVVDQSANYGDAKEGYSWSLIGGEWNWATAPTPSIVNASVYVEPDDFSPAATVAAVKKAATKKAAATKKSATPKTSKAAAKTSTSPGVGSTKTDSQTEGQTGSSSWWVWLLIALGVGTIGYGIYEYRSDIQLFFQKFGAKFGIGRKIS